MRTFTAHFPKVAYAQKFAERITEPGWSAVNVVQKGRTVTWESSSPEPDYTLDMLETVGYYGSTTVRRATLNGVPAPVSY